MNKKLHQKINKYFKDGIFRINLTNDETENKILIPGHRFIPFLNPDKNLNSITLYDRKGNILKSKIISVSSERIKQYYSLFGLDNFMFILIRDIEENSRIIMKPSSDPKKFKITVYNIEPLFSLPAGKGDRSKLSLVIKIIDWEEGVYSAELAEHTGKTEDVSLWIKNLENGLLQAGDYKSETDSIEDYLSTAFMLGGEYLVKNPAVTLEEFQDFSEKNFLTMFHSKSAASRILETRKQQLNSKINTLIENLLSVENRIISGELRESRNKIISLERISNTISTLRSFSAELDNPEINEEKLSIIIRIINDSEKLAQL